MQTLQTLLKRRVSAGEAVKYIKQQKQRSYNNHIPTKPIPSPIMTPLFALLSVLGFLSSFASATALTYKLPPNGKECFFAFIEQKQAKVAFYFAVCAFASLYRCIKFG